MIVRGWRSRRPSESCSGRDLALSRRAARPDSLRLRSTRPSPLSPGARRSCPPGRIAAVAAGALDELRDRGERPDVVRWPGPGTSAAVASAASRPAGVDGSPSRRVAAMPTSSVEWASDTATPGQAVSRERMPPPARCPPADDPGVVGLDPVDERRRGPRSRRPPSADRAAEAVERVRDARRGRPGRGPRRSPRRAGGRAGWPRARNRQIRSPSAVFTSSPTITVIPGMAAVAGAQGAVDPVVVGDREVGEPAVARPCARP